MEFREVVSKNLRIEPQYWLASEKCWHLEKGTMEREHWVFRHKRYGRVASRTKRIPPLATFAPQLCTPYEREHFEIRRGLAELKRSFQLEQEEACAWSKMNVEKNKKILKLEDEIYALHS